MQLAIDVTEFLVLVVLTITLIVTIYQSFLIKPKFRFLVSQPDRETWKDTYSVVSQALIPKYHCEVHFLGFSVMNYGRAVAGESKGYIFFTEPPTLTSYLQGLLMVDYSNIVRTFQLRWAEPDVRKIESEADTVGEAIVGALPKTAVIVPPQGEILDVLFTVKGDDKAHLATERLTPLQIPSRTYVVIIATSTSPPATHSEMFCLVLKSWDNFYIEKVSARSLMSDSIRKVLSFRTKTQALSST